MRTVKYLSVLAAALFALNVTRAPSHAIPNFARKYGVSCDACHSPAPPRLNKAGHQFRKMGYRMPTEVGKKPDYKEIGEYLAVRQRTRYNYTSTGKAGAPVVSEFNFNDSTLFYAGPVTKDLSIFTELEHAPAEPSVEAQVFAEWTKGDLNNYTSVRFGQMHLLARVGFAGFDRPSGLSTPWILANPLTAKGKDAFTGTFFTVGGTADGDQRGLEITHGWKENSRVIFQVLNGDHIQLNDAGKVEAVGNENMGHADSTTKDFLVGYEQILDDRGSGFTLYGYRGTVINGPKDPTDATKGSLLGGPIGSTCDFTRIGVTGSWLSKPTKKDKLPWEIQGGYMHAKDNAPSGSALSDITGDGWYLDVEKYLPHNAGVFARYDKIDPNKDVSGKDMNKTTVGGVYNANDHWRLAAELFRQTGGNKGVQVESMINF